MTLLPRPRVELRRALRSSDLAAWQVAHVAGMSPALLSNICTGRRGFVTRDEAARIAAALECGVEELFAGEELAAE